MINLKDILEKHELWLNDEKGGERGDLSWADLSGANLSGANLREADLSDTKLYNYSIVPDKGQFIVYKKVDSYILTLLVSKNAKRIGGLIGRKCRVSKVKVLKIELIGKTQTYATKVSSNYNPEFIYKLGKWISEPNFSDDIRVECAPGIHCFITKQEAIDY